MYGSKVHSYIAWGLEAILLSVLLVVFVSTVTNTIHIAGEKMPLLTQTV